MSEQTKRLRKRSRGGGSNKTAASKGRHSLTLRSLHLYEQSLQEHESFPVSRIIETIAPGQEQKDAFDLMKLAAIRQGGRYAVQVERASPLDSGQTLASNVLTITVNQ